MARGSTRGAQAAARLALRLAFGGDASSELSPSWSAERLSASGVGAWAHPTLLALHPAPTLRLETRAPASDGTERLLLQTHDGGRIETVIIPASGRTTLCVSSQVGCARACAFCETGRLGLERQLATAEIVDQVRIARALWGREERRPPIQNLVFMGMGEPFDNLPEVSRAIRLLASPHALGFSPSRITVSTVGVADKLGDFFASCPAELAVSLNAPDDARRQRVMPVNARFDMATLRRAIETHLPPGKKVLFEYVLFDGLNDALEDADLLAAYVRGLRCRINVIPCNPGPDPELRPPSPERLDAFVARLVMQGLTTLVRRPRGRDVGGACGQLAGARRLKLLTDAAAT